MFTAHGAVLARWWDKRSTTRTDPRLSSSTMPLRDVESDELLSTGSLLCAVKRLRAWLAALSPPLLPHEPLVPQLDASGVPRRDARGVPLRIAASWYESALHKAARAAGVPNADLLAPRGLRSGGAGDALLEGFEGPDLDRRGGWRDPSTKLLRPRQRNRHSA